MNNKQDTVRVRITKAGEDNWYRVGEEYEATEAGVNWLVLKNNKRIAKENAIIMGVQLSEATIENIKKPYIEMIQRLQKRNLEQAEFYSESEVISIIEDALSEGDKNGMLLAKDFWTSYKENYNSIPASQFTKAASLPVNKVVEDKREVSDLAKAIKVLKDALNEDKSEGSYYYTWQSNIAMAFQDAFAKHLNEEQFFTKYLFSDNGVHEISNEAAKNFLNLLISQPTSTSSNTPLK